MGWVQDTAGTDMEPTIGCATLGIQGLLRSGLRGFSQWVKGDNLQHPSSHVEQHLQPDFRWVYKTPRCAPRERGVATSAIALDPQACM